MDVEEIGGCAVDYIDESEGRESRRGAGIW